MPDPPQFRENIKMTYRTLRDHVFNVSGGAITKARRLEHGSNVGGTITVEASCNAVVTLMLSATTDSSAQGAVCTQGGKKLSEGLELAVSQPRGG